MLFAMKRLPPETTRPDTPVPDTTLFRSGEVELVDGGAAFLDLHAVVADVRGRTDRDIKFAAVRAGEEVARPVAGSIALRGQVDDLDPRSEEHTSDLQ